MEKPEPKATPQNILVVDDEQQVCQLLAEALVFMGHNVQMASDGNEAIEKLHASSFSIVITDMDMPRMDGMELIRHIAENRNGVDIIAITGHTMKYKYTDVVAAGAADFIAKPFTLNELEAKLNRIMRERYLRDELERLAVRDPLTGLYNRHYFEKVVRREVLRADRYGHSLFLFFFDIDNFKDYNDQYGHQAGDSVLVRFGEVLTALIRQGVDTAFRFGGDEFTVILPHLQCENAQAVAERIREKYNSLGFKPTFLSTGIARYIKKHGDLKADIEDLIQRADSALYHAKLKLGGDCTYTDEESCK